MISRRLAATAVAYILAGAGGIIYARHWEHMAVAWCLLVFAYAAVVVDGRLMRLPRGG